MFIVKYCLVKYYNCWSPVRDVERLVSYIILGCLTLLTVVQSLYAWPEDFHQIFIDPSSDPVFLRKHWLLQPLRNAQISLKILLLREKGLKLVCLL